MFWVCVTGKGPQGILHNFILCRVKQKWDVRILPDRPSRDNLPMLLADVTRVTLFEIWQQFTTDKRQSLANLSKKAIYLLIDKTFCWKDIWLPARLMTVERLSKIELSFARELSWGKEGWDMVDVSGGSFLINWVSTFLGSYRATSVSILWVGY